MGIFVFGSNARRLTPRYKPQKDVLDLSKKIKIHVTSKLLLTYEISPSFSQVRDCLLDFKKLFSALTCLGATLPFQSLHTFTVTNLNLGVTLFSELEDQQVAPPT